MRVMVVRGAPRAEGFTNRITDLFVEGLRRTESVVDDIDLSTRDIHACTGCYRCWTAHPGRCIFDDDMTGLIDLLVRADVIVFSTPLYYYSVSSRMKMFLERTFPITRHGFELAEGGLMRNKLRCPGGKKLVLLAAGAYKDPREFEPLRATFRSIARGMSAAVTGEIVRPESFLLQFSVAKPKTVKSIETALVRAGFEAGTDGAVAPDTAARAAAPLTSDIDLFVNYSNIYWEYVTSLGPSADLDEVRKGVATDVRILMSEMARGIDPITAAKLRAVVQFDFPDKDYHFCLRIDRGACALTEERAPAPDLRIETSCATWGAAFSRAISMKDALMDGSIKLEGDKGLFARLDRYFPPPES